MLNPGLLPLVNLSAKGSSTSTKNVERIGSYQWYLEEDEPIIIVGSLQIKIKLLLFRRYRYRECHLNRFIGPVVGFLRIMEC